MGAEPGWLLPLSSATAVAVGRVQAALSSCPLHKGTILGAPSHPHQGTSSSPAGMGMGTGTALGAQQSAQEAVGFLKEQQCWGWRGLPASHPSGDVPVSHGDTSQHRVALAGGSTWTCGARFVCCRELLWVCLSSLSSLQGSPKGWGVTGCCPHLFRASQELSRFVCCCGSWKEPCAGRQSGQEPCPCQQEGFICAWVLF